MARDALSEEGILSEEICNNPADTRLNRLLITSGVKAKQGRRPSEFVLKWSGWNKPIYTAVQEQIKKCKPKNIHILKYENELWMKQVIEK